MGRFCLLVILCAIHDFIMDDDKRVQNIFINLFRSYFLRPINTVYIKKYLHIPGSYSLLN